MRNFFDDDRPLRLVRIIDIDLDGVTFDRSSVDLSSIDDLRCIYGEDMPHDWLTESTGASYPALVSLAHDVLVREGFADRICSIVLAIALPDSQHRLLLGGYTTHLFASRPNTFAVTEQGAAGPFTALALAGLQIPAADASTAATGADDACALVLVLEQRTLPPAANAPRPTADRVVVLLVGRGRVGRVIEEISVEPLRGHMAENAADREGCLVISGIDVNALDMTGVEALQPASPTASAGVWGVLASLMETADSEARPITVVEADRFLGYRCEFRLAGVEPEMGDLGDARVTQEVLA